jgi:gliding motility-associated-like protein
MIMNKTTLILLCLLFSIGNALAQPINDNCGGATNIGTLPTPGPCVSGLQNGAVTTLNNQTTVASTSPNPYVYLTACQGSGDMTAFALDTWYAFTATGSTVNVTITGFPGVQMALYSGTCGNLLGRGCSINGTLNATQIIIGQTYYLQISGNTTTATDNNFSIAIDNDIDCNDCLLGSSLTATPAPVNGGYSPGQVVQFCFNVSNYTEVNTNWFHGVQISLGPGWTGVISNPTPANDCPVDPPISGTPFVNEGTGIWRWYPNGVTSATTGITWPAGFYFDNSNVAGTNAGNNFGDPGNCGWTFCWSLTVAPGCSNGENLNVTVNTTGDGESGSWSNLGCVDDPPTIFSAIELCCEALATNTGPYCPGATIQLNGTGGGTYSWTGPNGFTSTLPNPTLPATTAASGVYTLSINNGGCIATSTTTVVVNPLPAVNAGNNVSVCQNLSTTLTATGASTYVWSPVITNGVAFVPSATTTYTVTGTSAAGCVNTDQVIVTVNPLPTIVANNVSVCATGTVIVSATGGNTYSWSPSTYLSATTGASVTFTPGITSNYTITGTDINGCTNTDPVTVTVLANAPINAGTDVAICNGASTSLTATGGVTYTWSPATGLSATTGNTVTANPTATTTYTVVGTDASGCIGTDQVVVTVNPLPIVNAGVDQTVCVGTAVTLTATGATAYSWSPTATNGVAFTPASTTTYTVTGTTLGCTGTDQVIVTVNPLPVVNAGADQTLCQGPNVTLTATGATTYTWTPTITNGVAFTPTAGATTYTVVGTSNGCTGTDQVVVTVNAIPTVNAGADQSICQGATVTLTATGASSYTWTPTITNGTAFTPALGATTYSVTGTTAEGCTGTDQLVLTVNPTPAPIIQGPTTYCPGNSPSLSTSVAFTNYTWSTGVGTATASVTQANNPITVTVTNSFGCTGTSQAFNVTQTTAITTTATVTICQGQSSVIHGITQTVSNIYTQTFVSVQGCDSISNVTLVVNPLPTVNAGIDQTACTGTQITLNATGASTYSWSPVATNGIPFTQAIGTTTYTATGTSAEGCVNTDQVVVTVNPLPTVNAGIDQTICIGQTVTLAGAGANSYSWTAPVQNNVAFSPSATTTYTVTGTSLAGCINTDQVLVTVNPLPTVAAGNDQTICNGQAVTLSGGGAATYTWTAPVQNGVPFSPTTTATYTVSGTSAAGCINTDQVLVTVNPIPTVTAGNDVTICVGASVTLSGGGATTYSWTPAVNNGIAFTPAVGTTTFTLTGTSAGCTNTDQVVVTVNPLPAISAGADVAVCAGQQVTLNASGATNYSWSGGITNGFAFTPNSTTIYTVTGTSAAGCIATDQVLVTVNPIPNVFAGNDVETCLDQTVVLTGSGAATYTWAPTVTNGVAFTPAVGVTTYTVTGTSAAGCTNTDQVLVTVNATLNAAFIASVTEGCAPLTVTFTNNTANSFDCVWTMSDGTVLSGCTSVTNTFEQPGCYDISLTVTAANGCVTSLTQPDLVCVDANPVASFIPSAWQISELDMNVDFNNTSDNATQYIWNFGDTSPLSSDENPSHDYTGNEIGIYDVTLIAFSPAGCTDTAYSTIQIYEEVIFYVPNTFTPDNDTYNPTFKPIFTSGYDPFDYSLYIYDRWGELIFESHNTEVGWNGTYGSNQEIDMVQDGTYTWKIEFKVTKNDERRMEVGHVNVIR